MCLAFWILLSVKQTRLIFLILIFVAISLYGQAYIKIFQPNLANFFDVVDYQLSPRVAAKWSLSVAKHHLKTLVGNVFIFLPFILVPALRTHLKKSHFFFILIASAAMNTLVSFVQRFYSNTFLAEGSGTALAARRTPALLEDSGASTIFFAVICAGLLFATLAKNSSKRQRFFYTILLLFCIAAAFFGVGRAFFAGLIPIVVLFLIYLWREIVFKVGAFKSLMIVTILVGAFSAFLYLLSKVFISHTILSALGRLNRFRHGEITWEGFWRAFDSPRYDQWLAMLQTIRENPVLGTGLGTSMANLDRYYGGVRGFLDWPGSFYLMFPSELGLIGWLISLSLVGLLITIAWNLATLQFRRNTFSAFEMFCFGGLLTLGVTYLIGIHFVFQSIGVLFVFMLIVSVDSLMARLRNFSLFVKFFFLSLAGLGLFQLCWVIFLGV